MGNHLRVARVHKVLSLIYLALGCIVLPMIAYLIYQDSVKVNRTVEVGFLIFVFLFAYFHHCISKAAKELMPWAKVASVIIGIFLLSGFPIGTLVGVYLILNCRKWPAYGSLSSANLVK